MVASKGPESSMCTDYVDQYITVMSHYNHKVDFLERICVVCCAFEERAELDLEGNRFAMMAYKSKGFVLSDICTS